MVDSLDSRSPLSPAELVGNRIDENRLFEARFLFNKFSSAIDPAVRKQLQQQLETRIARAEQAFAQGELLEQTGELEKAMNVYDDVAAIAVDYPSLPQAQQRVEIAINLGPLQAIEPLDSESPVPEPSQPVTPPEATCPPVVAPSFFRQNKVPLLLAFSLLAVLGLGGVLILFRPDNGPEVTREILHEKGLKKKDEPVVARPAMQPQPEIIPQVEEPSLVSATVSVEEPAIVPDTRGVVQENRNDPIGTETGAAEKSDVQAPISPEETGVEQELSADAEQELSVVGQVDSPSAPGTDLQGPEEDISDLVSPAESEETYTVRSGDTLESIAAKVYGNRFKWSRLVSANQEKFDRPPYVLSVGMVLRVPSLALLESKEATVQLNKDGTYTVQSGDSLGSIALKIYGSSKEWNTIYKLNRNQLPTPGSLQVGQMLRVNNKKPVDRDNDPVGE